MFYFKTLILIRYTQNLNQLFFDPLAVESIQKIVSNHSKNCFFGLGKQVLSQKSACKAFFQRPKRQIFCKKQAHNGLNYNWFKSGKNQIIVIV